MYSAYTKIDPCIPKLFRPAHLAISTVYIKCFPLQICMRLLEENGMYTFGFISIYIQFINYQGELQKYIEVWGCFTLKGLQIFNNQSDIYQVEILKRFYEHFFNTLFCPTKITQVLSPSFPLKLQSVFFSYYFLDPYLNNLHNLQTLI